MNKALIIFLLAATMVLAQTTESTTTTTTSSSTDLTSEVKTTTKRRRLKRSRIQALEEYHKERKGKNIFGLGLVGFNGNMGFGSNPGAQNAGAPSDSFSGIGMGILFDIQLAGGSTNSIGIRTSGKWYWRWGVRAHLDFFRHGNKSDTLSRELNEVYASFVAKYYFPMDEYNFSRKIIVLNRFHFFLGIGPMWSVAINDTVENLTDRTFSRGPTQSDFFFATEAGFNFRITPTTFLTFDYRLGLNLSGTIIDEVTAKEVEGSGGGMVHALHAGFAFVF